MRSSGPGKPADGEATIPTFGLGQLWKGAKDVTASLVAHAEEAMKLAQPVAETAYEKTVEGVNTATKAFKAVKNEVTTIVDTLKSARQHAHDPEKLVDSFLSSVPHVQKYVDSKADAVGIGYSGEAVAGYGKVIGAEIVYVRAKGDTPARIRVNDLEGEVGRISIGAGTRAFVRCAYGDPEAIVHASSRTGGELGLLVASAGLFEAKAEGHEKPVKGWTAGLGVGGGLGIPLVSDAGWFRISENRVSTIDLTPEAAAKIEEALKQAPDRSWLRERALAL